MGLVFVPEIQLEKWSRHNGLFICVQTAFCAQRESHCNFENVIIKQGVVSLDDCLLNNSC